MFVNVLILQWICWLCSKYSKLALFTQTVNVFFKNYQLTLTDNHIHISIGYSCSMANFILCRQNVRSIRALEVNSIRLSFWVESMCQPTRMSTVSYIINEIMKIRALNITTVAFYEGWITRLELCIFDKI